MRESRSDSKREIISLTDQLSATFNPRVDVLKVFFLNILVLEELVDYLVELRREFEILLGLNLKHLKPMEMTRVMEPLATEYMNYLKRKGLKLASVSEKNMISLIYRDNPSGIESRLDRLINLVAHMFNTPTTYVAIALNIDRSKLKSKIGEEIDRKYDPLIDLYSWRDKLLKALLYYRNTNKLSKKDEVVLDFFEGYLKLSNIVEILSREKGENIDKRQIIRRIGEPMSKIFSGLLTFKELSFPSRAGIKDVISHLMPLLSSITATFGKILGADADKVISNGIGETFASLYVLGLKVPDTSEGKRVELMRSKLARLIIDRHHSASSNYGENKAKDFEGENFWRAILVDQLLCNNTFEIFQILGIQVENIHDEINYDKFFKLEEEV